MILFKHSINLMISWALFKDELVTTTLHYKLHTSHDAMNQTRIVVIVEIYKKTSTIQVQNLKLWQALLYFKVQVRCSIFISAKLLLQHQHYICLTYIFNATIFVSIFIKETKFYDNKIILT
jgi:hypothetical protein